MKKLVFFARTLEIGGVERALVNLLNALAPSYAVTLVLAERRGELLPELDKRVRLLSVPPGRSALRPLRRAQSAARLLLWAIAHARRCDFACAYDTEDRFGARLARLASKNACLVVHNDYARVFPEPAAYAAFFRSLHAARFRRLLFVSRESRAAFAGRLPALAGRTAVIGNLTAAARLRRLAAAPCPFHREAGETVFIFLGRLDERQKRLSRLLEGFRLALSERGGLRLLLVGDGPDRADCERYLRDHGLMGRVLLCGAQPNPYPFLLASDCLVLASEHEGFPMVCYEALALGRDVISTCPADDGAVDLRRCATLCGKTPEALAAAMAAYRSSGRARLDTDALDEAKRRAWEALF